MSRSLPLKSIDLAALGPLVKPKRHHFIEACESAEDFGPVGISRNCWAWAFAVSAGFWTVIWGGIELLQMVWPS